MAQGAQEQLEIQALLLNDGDPRRPSGPQRAAVVQRLEWTAAFLADLPKHSCKLFRDPLRRGDPGYGT